ncbi:MAG: ABC transporter permease [Candidatus Saliniplasma sp.]
MKRTPFNAFLRSKAKRRIRNKRFLVWILIMPILFMGCLNLIWGEDSVQPHVAVLNQDDSDHSEIAMGFLRSQDNINVKEVLSLDEGIDELRGGDVEAFLVIPDDFGEKWMNISEGEEYESIVFDVYHSGGEQEEELIDILLKGITSDINDYIEGDKKRPVEIKSRKLDLDRGSTSNMLLPAGISIVMVHIGVYASSSDASRFEEYKLSKRLKASPKNPIFSILGMITVDSLFTALAGLIALISGLVLFEISISLIVFIKSIVIFLTSGLIFTLIGHLVGKFSDVQTSSQSISSMVVFPILFFTQAFLFSSLFPEYITKITQYLPTFPLAEGMKKLYFAPSSPTEYLLLLLISFIWIIAMTVLCYIFENRRV